MPRSCTSRCSAARTSSAATGSRADVGSSSTRMRGPAASTAAIATRCCWPPERSCSGAAAQLGQAEQVEGLLDPASHRGGLDAHRLHPVGELLLDGVGDEGGDRVLPDDADDVGEVAGPVRAGVPPVDHDRAAQPAAGEVRHQPVDARAAASTCPLPVGPTTRTSSPSGTVRSTSRAGGRGRRPSNRMLTSWNSIMRSSPRRPAGAPAAAGPVPRRRRARRTRWRGRRAAARAGHAAGTWTGVMPSQRLLGRDHEHHRRQQRRRTTPATPAAPTGRGGSATGSRAGRRRAAPGRPARRRPATSGRPSSAGAEASSSP